MILMILVPALCSRCYARLGDGNSGAAQFSAELAHDVLLVMTGHGLTHSDAELVRVFCAELLLARRRAQHDELRSSTSGSE
jgi:hypothetical protein